MRYLVLQGVSWFGPLWGCAPLIETRIYIFDYAGLVAQVFAKSVSINFGLEERSLLRRWVSFKSMNFFLSVEYLEFALVLD